MKVYKETFYKRHLEGSLNSAKEIVPLLLKLVHPSSVIDVGCGLGLWLSIFRDGGIEDICGVDGDYVKRGLLRIPHDKFIAHDLNEPLRMSRKYDLVLCLEVAEHIPQNKAETFIRSLTDLGSVVVFSAACPNQHGEHHINCQWPNYWQRIFNNVGFVCDDAVRWEIWNIQEIEPWYRQNMFIGSRNIEKAGSEKRIASVIHPEMIERSFVGEGEECKLELLKRIENGSETAKWYLTTVVKAFRRKLKRWLTRYLIDGRNSTT